jgi:hypothetical protein
MVLFDTIVFKSLFHQRKEERMKVWVGFEVMKSRRWPLGSLQPQPTATAPSALPALAGLMAVHAQILRWMGILLRCLQCLPGRRTLCLGIDKPGRTSSSGITHKVYKATPDSILVYQGNKPLLTTLLKNPHQGWLPMFINPSTDRLDRFPTHFLVVER